MLVISSYPLCCPTDRPPRKRKPYALCKRFTRLPVIYEPFTRRSSSIVPDAGQAADQARYLFVSFSAAAAAAAGGEIPSLPFPSLWRTPSFARRPMFRWQLYLPSPYSCTLPRSLLLFLGAFFEGEGTNYWRIHFFCLHSN